MSRSVAKESYCKCLYYSASALARKVTRMAEKEFETTGLAPSLGFIVMTVNSKPGIPAGEIAGVMQLNPSTITRLVDKLVKDGFLRRRTDGRFIHVYPTAKAKQADGALRDAWRKLYVRYTSILGEEQGRDLTATIYDAANRLG